VDFLSYLSILLLAVTSFKAFFRGLTHGLSEIKTVKGLIINFWLTPLANRALRESVGSRVFKGPGSFLPDSTPHGHFKVDQRVQKIQQIMRDNLHREVSLRELAQSVNLSVWRLSHIFSSEVGMSPIKYLRLLRMERARHLLETGYLSIKEIGYRVGLNDESHFVRDFKKTYGAPPTLYRMRFNGKHQNESGNGKTPRGEIKKELAKAAKLCVLPALNIFSYLVSWFEILV
jgi:AraC-like DNA-binding protein